jgi:hypothetical protein
MPLFRSAANHASSAADADTPTAISEPSRSRLCVRMAREIDPYAFPVTSIGRNNRLATGYANKSLRTRLTARPGRGISDDRTSASNDMLMVVPVSEPDSATQLQRSSVGLDADAGSDDSSGGLQRACSDVSPAEPDVELLLKRAASLVPPASWPPETPAGRLVFRQLPGRFPHIHGAALPAARDLVAPPTSKPPMVFRVGAVLERSFRRGSAIIASAHQRGSALLFFSPVDLSDGWFRDVPSAEELPSRSDMRRRGWAA